MKQSFLKELLKRQPEEVKNILLLGSSSELNKIQERLLLFLSNLHLITSKFPAEGKLINYGQIKHIYKLLDEQSNYAAIVYGVDKKDFLKFLNLFYKKLFGYTKEKISLFIYPYFVSSLVHSSILVPKIIMFYKPDIPVIINNKPQTIFFRNFYFYVPLDFVGLYQIPVKLLHKAKLLTINKYRWVYSSPESYFKNPSLITKKLKEIYNFNTYGDLYRELKIPYYVKINGKIFINKIELSHHIKRIKYGALSDTIRKSPTKKIFYLKIDYLWELLFTDIVKIQNKAQEVSKVIKKLNHIYSDIANQEIILKYYKSLFKDTYTSFLQLRKFKTLKIKYAKEIANESQYTIYEAFRKIKFLLDSNLGFGYQIRKSPFVYDYMSEILPIISTNLVKE